MPPERVREWQYPPDRWARLALVTWVAAILALFLHLLLSSRYGGVYPIFAGAARNWLAGEEVYLVYNDQDVYRYSPLITALLSPFGLLPDRLGGLLWRLINLTIFLGALGWWVRAVLGERFAEVERTWLFLLILPLALGNFHNGQCNLLVLGLLLATQAAVAEGCWNRAAVFAALAAWLKVYPLAAGLLLAAVYRAGLLADSFWRALLDWSYLSCCSAPEYVASQYTSWLNRLGTDDRQVESLTFWYRDLRLLFAVWLVPLPNRVYLLIQLVTGCGMAWLCVAARRAGWPPHRLLPLLLALGCCWMTALGPASESATYVLVAPSMCWALIQEWRSTGCVLPRLLLAGGYGLLVATQLSVWFPFGRAFHSLGPHPAAVMLFLAGLLLCELLGGGSHQIEPWDRDRRPAIQAGQRWPAWIAGLRSLWRGTT